MKEKKPEEAIVESIGGFDEEVVNEVILESDIENDVKSAATNLEMSERRKEALSYQQELIEDEREEIQETSQRLQEEIEHMSHHIEELEGEPTLSSTSSSFGDGSEQHQLSSDGKKITIEKEKEDFDVQKEEEEDGEEAIETKSKEELIQSQLVLKRQLLAEVESLGLLMNPSYLEEEKNLLSDLRVKLENKVKAMEDLKIDDQNQEEEDQFGREIDEKRPKEELVDSITKGSNIKFEELIDTAPILDTSNLDEKIQDPSTTQLSSHETDQQKYPKKSKKQQSEEEEEEYLGMEVKMERHAYKNEDAMQAMIERMFDDIEKEVEKADREIGEKMYLLDKDKDGKLSSQEMREVVQHTLKRYSTEEEADAFVQSLDKDQDGVISVQELLQWVEARKDELDSSTIVSPTDDLIPSSLPTTSQSSSSSSSTSKKTSSTKKEDKKKSKKKRSSSSSN